LSDLRIAFDVKGRLDILESSTAGGGALPRATSHGPQPATATDLGVPGLNSPVGLAIAKSGTDHAENPGGPASPPARPSTTGRPTGS
jgi:hypothetical protein